MLYSPKSIANHFLALAKAGGQSVSPMKLQKLVYYAHGWYAGYTGRPLIDEAVEAWPYGPVIPSLYHEFKRFGAAPIVGKATEFVNSELREAAAPSDPELRSFLDKIWASYGQFTGSRLSDMTHAAGGPWDQTWKEASGMRGTDIPFERIAGYFAAAAARTKERGAQS